MATVTIGVEVDTTGNCDYKLHEVCTFLLKDNNPGAVLPLLISTLDIARRRVMRIQDKFTTTTWGVDVVANTFEDLFPITIKDDSHLWRYGVIVVAPPRKESNNVDYAEIAIIHTKLFPYAGITNEPQAGVYPWYYGSNPDYSAKTWVRMVNEHVNYSLNTAKSERDAADKWSDMLLRERTMEWSK